MLRTILREITFMDGNKLWSILLIPNGKLILHFAIISISRSEWMENKQDFCHSLVPLDEDSEDEAFVDDIIKAQDRLATLHSESTISASPTSTLSEIASDSD